MNGRPPFPAGMVGRTRRDDNPVTSLKLKRSPCSPLLKAPPPMLVPSSGDEARRIAANIAKLQKPITRL